MSVKPPISEVLATTIELLTPPGSWCQGTMARDARGEPCDHTSHRVVSRCVYGAISAAAGHDDALVDRVDEFLVEAWNTSASAINDGAHATQARVLEKLKQARNLALIREGTAPVE